MTEDEAKLKWCPFARVTDGGGSDGRQLTATNRHAGKKIGKDGKPRILRGNSLCIASDCMAWRSYSRLAGNGFCGLAGEPPVSVWGRHETAIAYSTHPEQPTPEGQEERS